MQPVLDWPGDGGGQRRRRAAPASLSAIVTVPAEKVLPALVELAENAATVPVATQAATMPSTTSERRMRAGASRRAPGRDGRDLERDLVGAALEPAPGAWPAAVAVSRSRRPAPGARVSGRVPLRRCARDPSKRVASPPRIRRRTTSSRSPVAGLARERHGERDARLVADDERARGRAVRRARVRPASRTVPFGVTPSSPVGRAVRVSAASRAPAGREMRGATRRTVQATAPSTSPATFVMVMEGTVLDRGRAPVERGRGSPLHLMRDVRSRRGYWFCASQVKECRPVVAFCAAFVSATLVLNL